MMGGRESKAGNQSFLLQPKEHPICSIEHNFHIFDGLAKLSLIKSQEQQDLFDGNMDFYLVQLSFPRGANVWIM
jgi:hypothetical protein